MDWRLMKNFAVYFLVSLLPMSRCVRWAGRRLCPVDLWHRIYPTMSIWYGYGYGDGRAISVFEGIINGQRWEMQLKGWPNALCRGADGLCPPVKCAFLAQDYMQALGVPTSRSLTLYVSKSETVTRPWYSQDSTLLTLMFWWTILWPFQLALHPPFARWSARVIVAALAAMLIKSIRRVEHDSVALNWASTKATLIKALVLPIN